MRIVVYAVSTSHASELLESVRRLGWEVAAAVRNVEGGAVPVEVGTFVDVDQVQDELRGLPFAVPQTSPASRRAAIEDALARGLGSALPVIDPSATVAGSAAVGDGAYVGAGAVIAAGAVLGRGTLVNRSASIGHHVSFGEYATTGPGVVLSGCCIVEEGAFLGSGCVIAPERRIGAGSVVGAGAVVIRDVPAGATVVGNPARPV